MKHVESYIPELRYFQSKHQSSARRIHEDLAVLDAKDLRVLAGRGRFVQNGEPIADLWGLSHKEIAFLQNCTPSAFCTALLGTRGVVLVFADLLRECGILLAILPHAETAQVLRALSYIEEPIKRSPALSAYAVSEIHTDERVCEEMQEIFFYATRITRKKPDVGIWTRTLLISNLVGCRTDEASLPTQELPLADTELSKLTAFLLCAFLVLRQRDGRVGAWCEDAPPNPTLYSYQISFEPLPDRKQSAPEPLSQETDFPFLSHPAFTSFSLQHTEKGTLLQAILPRGTAKELLLRNALEDFFCLRIQMVSNG